MSREQVEMFRSALEAFNRGDVPSALKNIDPQVEWQTPRSLPDPQTYYGHEGVESWWAMMRDAFVELRLEPGEFQDLGEGQVLVPVRASGRGRESGVEVSVSFFLLGWGREKLERMEFFPNETEALEAVGLSEQDAHADS
jgi:ketosteroid isomerase-like protein